jgi:hypothetical protein
MFVFTCVGFPGWNPVGTSAVVIAQDEEQAAALLKDNCRERGLSRWATGDYIMELVAELHPAREQVPSVKILQDGDY